MRNCFALLSVLLVLLGPQGFAGLHHDALHSACAAADPCSPAGGSPDSDEGRASLLSTSTCWICTSAAFSPGETQSADLSIVKRIVECRAPSFVRQAPRTPLLFPHSSRAPPLA